jgi:hypothetical protein
MALTISIVSLVISGLTFWLTRLRKGKLKMTHPSIICFMGQNGRDEPKVFMRTLLYATADLGQYIQNMFVRVHRAETIQNFNIWVYNDKELVRGSGLFVGKAGISTYHHFLLPNKENWEFIAGEYTLEIFAELVDNRTKKLFELKLHLSKDEEHALRNDKKATVFFNWAPNAKNYSSHIDIRPFTKEELQALLI